MDETPNLKLPYILAAQAQKHVTHNEAIRALDAVVQLMVLDRDLSAPPGSPANGDRYIVAATPTGAWSGQAGRVAAFQDGAWAFYVPVEGWVAWIADEDRLVAWNGSNWVATGGGGSGVSLNPATGGLLGVNATADAANRLSVNSANSLFNHDGADHRLKINKAAAANTASVLFQTGFSGRAEFGLAGDDNWRVKVSPNGTTWHEALVVDGTTGAVSFPNTSLGGGSSSVAPNLIVNGDFQINQRVFAGGALAAGVYGFDRWKAATGGANLSISGYTVTLTSGEIEQVVEVAAWGYASLASQQVTISVEAPSADLTVTFGSQSGTIPAGSGRRSVTLTLGTGDTGNLTLRLKRTTAGSVTFSRVKLEVGTTATAWQARAATEELALCQRYFYVRRSTSTFDVLFMVSFYTTTQAWGGTLYFPVTMRAAPTVSISSLSDLAVYVTGAMTITNISTWRADQNGLFIPGHIAVSGSSFAGAAGMLYFNGTSGAIFANAEL